LYADSPNLLTVNLGAGQGVSMLEIFNTFTRVNGVQIPHCFVPSRAGHVAQCLAGAKFSKQLLNWRTELYFQRMCVDLGVGKP